MVTHGNLNVKVLHGSNPTSGHLFSWKIKVIYSHRYITLVHWVGNQRLITGVGSKSEIHDVFFIGEPMSFIIWSCGSK